MTREEFHRQRKSGIGSSDMPKITGFSPFGDARTVWAEKVSISTPPPEPTAGPLLRGHELEPIIHAKLIAVRPDLRDVELLTDSFYRNAERPHLVAHPDRIAHALDTIFEFKSVARSTWQRIQSEGLLPSWLVQGEHLLGVTGIGRVEYVVFCFETWEPPVILPYERNERMWDGLVVIGDRFWRYVEDVEAPPLGTFEKQEIPTGRLTLTIEQEEAVQRLVELRDAESNSRMLAAAHRDDILDAMAVGRYEGRTMDGRRLSATVYEQAGRKTLDTGMLETYGPLDPIHVRKLLVKSGIEGRDFLARLNDECRLDLSAFYRQGKPFKSIRANVAEREGDDGDATGRAA